MLAPAATIASIARESLEKADGNVIEAAKTMTNRVLKNDALFRQLMEPLCQSACYDAIRQVVRHSRRSMWDMKQPTPAEEKRRTEHEGEFFRATLYDFPLPDGTRLGDAIKSQILAGADFYAKQSKNMESKARFLTMVGAVANERKPLRKVASLTQLANLKKKAESR